MIYLFQRLTALRLDCRDDGKPLIAKENDAQYLYRHKLRIRIEKRRIKYLLDIQFTYRWPRNSTQSMFAVLPHAP